MNLSAIIKIMNTHKYIFGILVAFAIVGGTEQPLFCAPKGAPPDDLRTREFVIMGYQGLLFESRSGEGPYLQTLLELLNIQPEEKTRILSRIRTLTTSHLNIMDFADQVAQLQKGPATAPTDVPLPEGPGIISGKDLENHLDHLTRGMNLTIFTKGGGQFSGIFEEFAARRLWIRGSSKKSFHMDDILAVHSPPR